MARHMESAGCDIERPATWKRFTPKLCTDCKALCCYLIVEVTAEDLIRLGITDEDEVAFDMKNLVKRLKKEGLITRCNISKGKFTLATRKTGGCCFLDAENRCSVYEDRPEVCRQHPTRLSPRLGYCPWSPAH
ncbi:YkgJ family cysteine cluster protein [Desulfoluna sp.]|uniref:YkgJ family cysteine cluster protein n=1 Tax=Desulfoluna sp. TaxID=2045199 RepID=UPI00261CD649|nr:YkgJ family cysteine cluster protein [Desulfoluna sp.]